MFCRLTFAESSDLTSERCDGLSSVNIERASTGGSIGVGESCLRPLRPLSHRPYNGLPACEAHMPFSFVPTVASSCTALSHSTPAFCKGEGMPK